MSEHDAVAEEEPTEKQKMTFLFPRKLDPTESRHLKEEVLQSLLRFKPVDKATATDNETLHDLCDYTLAMISNQKTIEYMIRELLEMEADLTHRSQEIGAELYRVLHELAMQTSTATTPVAAASTTTEDSLGQAEKKGQQNEPSAPTSSSKGRIVSIKSSSEGNALTRSGALGSSKPPRKERKPSDRGRRGGGRAEPAVSFGGFVGGRSERGGRGDRDRGGGAGRGAGGSGARGSNNPRRLDQQQQELEAPARREPTRAHSTNESNSRRDIRGRAFDRLVTSTNGRESEGRPDDLRQQQQRGDRQSGINSRMSPRDAPGRGGGQRSASGPRDERGGRSSGRYPENRGGGQGETGRGRSGTRRPREEDDDHWGNHQNREPDFMPAPARGDGRTRGGEGRSGGRGSDGRGRDSSYQDSKRVRIDPADQYYHHNDQVGEYDSHGDGWGGRSSEGRGRGANRGGGPGGRYGDAAGRGHGGRSMGRGRGNGSGPPSASDVDNSFVQTEGSIHDEQQHHDPSGGDSAEGGSYYHEGGHNDSYHYQDNWHGGRYGGRGGGRYGGRQSYTYVAGRGRGRGPRTSSEGNETEGQGERDQAMANDAPSGDGIPHPSPIVAAAAAANNYSGGRDYAYRGRGRGRGRSNYRAQVQSLLASKTWVRKKDGGDNNDGSASAAGTDGGAAPLPNNDGGGAHGPAAASLE